jgi:hypothetical protein
MNSSRRTVAGKKFFVASALIVGTALLPTFSQAKTERTMYTPEMIAKAKQKIATQDWAKKQVAALEKGAQFYLAMSDEELWNYIPPAAQMRALNVHFGSDCPIHGAEIHRKGGHYPWIMSRDKPFQVKCPIGGEVYPSNKFEPWWEKGLPPVTPENSSPHEKYVDNGAGWVNEKGERYWFVPHYMFWQRWRKDVLGGVSTLSQAYLLTGKPEYGHKAAVMLARIAQEYPEMDYLKQAYHHGYPTKVRGKILDYIWETSTVSNLSSAYDAIYPATDLAADPKLAAFLKTKNIENLRTVVERDLITVMIDALMSNQLRGNMGMPQRAMTDLALVLDNNDPKKGHTTKELVEWILKTEPGKTTGEIDELFYNGYYRDGHGGESSPGYSAGWNNAFYEVAKDLNRLGVNLFERPKMKKMADILLDITMIGKFAPSIGDNGSIKGATKLWLANVFREAWLQYRDPRYAKALAQMGFEDRNLWEDSIAEEIAEFAKKHGTELDFKSRNLGGYGLAILETGTGDSRRAVSMYYGAASGGHGQRDRLSTEAFFFGKPMMTEHGYPAHWLPKNPYWTGNTISHYAVVVNRKWQENFFAGHLNLMATAPNARVMEADAARVYPNDVSLYRHTTAMIDISPSHSYLFDVWRVKGGTQHDWSFHGFPFADFSSPQFADAPVQKKGTLAGENIAFGADKIPEQSSGFQYLFNVQRAHIGSTPDTASATWKSQTDDTALNLTLLNPPAELIAADAEPELQPGAPETMKYLLARRQSDKEPLSSVFAAIIEPSNGGAKIRSATPLQPQNAAPDFAGARVELEPATTGEKPRVDYILSNLDGKTAVVLPENIEFAGEFGVVSDDALWLVNGTKLKSGALEIAAAPETATIAAVDASKNEITLDGAEKFNVAALPGKVVTIANDLHSGSYTVVSAARRDNQIVLNFGDVLPIIAAGHISAIDRTKNTITTDTVLTGHARVDGGQHQGRYLSDSAQKIKRKITAFDGKTFQLEGAIPEGTFADNRFFVVDFHEGDIVKIPSTQWIQQQSEHRYRVHSSTPFILTVPAQKGEHFVRAGKQWQPISARSAGGMVQFSLDPALWQSDETVLIVGKPTWLDLSDETAPQISAPQFDIKPSTKNALRFISAPRTLRLRASDAKSPLEISSLQVLLNGAPLPLQIKKSKDEKSAEITVTLPADLSFGTHALNFSVADRAVLSNRATRETQFEIVDVDNLASPARGAKLNADSSYPQYESLNALNDGKTQRPGQNALNDSTWASAEIDAPHWLEVNWDKPQTVGSVTLHWTNFQDTLMTSRRVEIQSWNGKAWNTLSKLSNSKDVAISTLRFAPVKTARLRVYQPVGSGHPSRPNLLWLSEIKVGSK